MAGQYCAIVSDNLDASILKQIEEVAQGYVLTSSDVTALEDDQHSRLLGHIEAQKASGEMQMAAIRQRAVEIRGAKMEADGRCALAVSINLTILMGIAGLRADLETGATSDAMNRYAKGLLYITGTYPDGTPNPLYGAAATYAADLAKNPKTVFRPNGEVDLAAAGRQTGLYQMAVETLFDDSYIIFNLATTEIAIGDGKRYELVEIFFNNASLARKTAAVNVIQLSHHLRFVKEAVPQTPAGGRQDMVLPARTTQVATPPPAPPVQAQTRPDVIRPTRMSIIT